MENKLLEAIIALTIQVKRIADAVERDQKKSIVEQRKANLKK
jgi:hypothetical protein